jgi:hypothetical protein
VPRLDSVTFRWFGNKWPGVQSPQHTALYDKRSFIAMMENHYDRSDPVVDMAKTQEVVANNVFLFSEDNRAITETANLLLSNCIRIHTTEEEVDDDSESESQRISLQHKLQGGITIASNYSEAKSLRPTLDRQMASPNFKNYVRHILRQNSQLIAKNSILTSKLESFTVPQQVTQRQASQLRKFLDSHLLHFEPHQVEQSSKRDSLEGLTKSADLCILLIDRLHNIVESLFIK